MSLITIGEFSHRTRLSPKALRLYDQLGLVVPAKVDTTSGYRLYSAEQVESARLVGTLRRIGMPLAQISAVLAMPPGQAAAAVADYWDGQEALAGERRDLVRYLTGKLTEQEHAMYEIELRNTPARKLITITKHVHAAEMEAFIDDARHRLLTAAPRLNGYLGAPFVTFYGEVSEDSDGPVEFCRPVSVDTSEEVIAGMHDVQLRSEAAHHDISIRLAPDLSWPQMLPAFDALSQWVSEHRREPRPGLRQVYLVNLEMTPPAVVGIDMTIALK
jgi:DNA-binding transcriptional MerR regulator